MPDDGLAIALQEWAVLCAALEAGQTIIAVRKGGIHERGGVFTPEHPRFLLLPSGLHQDGARLRPDAAAAWADVLAQPPEPGAHRLSAWAEVVRTWRLTEAGQIEALADELVLSVEEARARLAYRDQPWLHVLALRVHRLPAPVIIPDHPSYAGCRSWLKLQAPVDLAGSEPVLGDPAFADRLAALAGLLDAPASHP
jgi:hypothetical protein